MVLKYKVYVILDVVFIILGSLLQIIYIGRLIVITKILNHLRT